MKKIAALLVSIVLVIGGCSSPTTVDKTVDTSTTETANDEFENVSVPNFIGMNIDAAKVLAEKHGLEIDILPVTEGSATDGEIVYQSVDPHSLVIVGTVITVKVTDDSQAMVGGAINETPTTDNEYEEHISMPDFVGRLYSDSLENQYSILNFQVEYDYSEEYSEGIIFEQSIPEGADVVSGTSIRITVSLGSKGPQYPIYPMNLDTLGSLLSDYYDGDFSTSNIEFQNGIAMVVGQKKWLVFDEDGSILSENSRGSSYPKRLNNDTFYNNDVLYDKYGNTIVSSSKQDFDDVIFYDYNYLLVHKSESGFSQVKELYGFISTEGEWIKPLTENLKFFDYYDLNEKYDFWSSSPEFVRTGISSNYLLIRESYGHYVIYDIENDSICFDESDLDYNYYTYGGNLYFSNSENVYFTYFDTNAAVKKDISIKSDNFDNDFYYRNGVICEEDSTGTTRKDYFHESSDIYNIYDLDGNKIMGFDGYHIKYVYAYINDVAVVSARGADDDYYVCFIDKNGTLLFDPLLGNDDYILSDCIINKTGFICQPFYSGYSDNVVYIIGFDGSIQEIECKNKMISWNESSGYFITYSSLMFGSVCYYTLDGELRIAF